MEFLSESLISWARTAIVKGETDSFSRAEELLLSYTDVHERQGLADTQGSIGCVRS